VNQRLNSYRRFSLKLVLPAAAVNEFFLRDTCWAATSSYPRAAMKMVTPLPPEVETILKTRVLAVVFSSLKDNCW